METPAARDGGCHDIPEDPAVSYVEPARLIADPALSAGEKRRLLADWAQDIESRLASADDGMGPDTASGRNPDARLLQSIQACLETLPAEKVDPPVPPGGA